MEENQQNESTDTSLMSEEDAFGVAAATFGTYLPRFKMLLKGLGSKGKERVINALIEVPLNEADFNPTNKNEREAFLVGQNLFEAKFIMVMHAMTYHEEQKNKKPLAMLTDQDGEENVGT